MAATRLNPEHALNRARQGGRYLNSGIVQMRKKARKDYCRAFFCRYPSLKALFTGLKALAGIGGR
jgi:hypothetical protein